MEKKALLKTAVVRFMLVAAMVLGAALLPGSLLSVRAETKQLPDAANGIIKLTDGVRLSADWKVNENVTLDTASATFTKAPVSTSYVDDKGASHTAQAIPLDAAMTTLGDSNKEMWYVVPADTTLTYTDTDTITLAGNVNLILADGAVMNVGTEAARISGSGISGNGKNLTVYGQSNGENAGILKVYNNTINDANEYGIYLSSGSFIQNSGKVVADHNIINFFENKGGGIYCENFTVNGGSLDAKSKGSNAISVGGDITINGGSVTIRSTNTYALLSTNSRITINGGSVNAVSESVNAAINGRSVTINGGSVSATNTNTNYPNGVMATGGDIILGGFGADDSIFAGGYIVNPGYSVKVPEGRTLIDGNGSLYKGTLTPAQIAGKTLRPAYTVTVNIVDSINGKPVEKESKMHGRVDVSPKCFAARNYAGANKEVILTIAPDTGWELASFKIEKADGSTVEASGAGDAPTFNMPAESVTVTVAFSKIPVTASYVDYDGTSKTVQAIPLDKTMTTLGKPGTGGGIWYVVKENITFDEGITFYYDGTAPSSTVNLILEDDCTMSVGTEDKFINGSCVFEEHAVLNIYSQEKGTGELKVFGNGEANAIDLRMLTIYGGKLIAETADNTAIYVRGGDLSIHGGNVSVTAGKAAAVGFPEKNGEVSGTVLVQGGEFTAESSSEGSGYYTVSGGARFFAGNTIIKGPGVREDVELSYNDPGDSVLISKFAPGKKVTIDSNTHKEFTDGTNLYAGVLSDEQKTEIAGKTLYPGCGVSVQIQSQLGGNEVAEADRHGSVTPSKTLFKLSELTGSDQTVTLTIAPQTGYKLSGMQVVPGYGPAISTTRVSNTQYTFTMPNESVRVQAVFDTEWKVLEQELNEGGTVTLDQDYISSNEGPLVIYQGQTATLDLAGHTISRDLTSATDNGCVIKVNMGGKLTITDSSSGNTGKITGGNNSGNGGGVYVDKGDPSLNRMGGSLTMLGGQITGNKAAKGGGVYVEQGDQEGYGGSINVSGKPVITGNFLTDGASNSNVGLSSGTSITVIGALTEGADIDVTPSGYEKFAAGGGSYVIADTDLAKFEKDGSATAVAKKDTDGKAYFAEKELTDSMVSAIPAQAWTGSAIEPEVTVKDGDTPLTKDTNYTVAYSNNTDIGTNTATATITGLYNSSAASYYGSVEKIFSIVKADMPDLDVINKRYLYSEDYADSFSVTGVLPSDCGALSCTKAEFSDNLKFVTKPTVTSEGLLSFTIEKNSVNTTGTIKIAVETQNYKDSVVTVNILQGDSVRTKLKDGTSVSLKSDTLTYGQALSSLIFDQAVFVAVDNENTSVDGEIAWKAPDTVPVVGTVSADWVFTPINKIYLPCEGSTAIRVNKANSIVEKAPTARNLTYNGSAQDLVTEGIAEGGEMHYALGNATEATEQYTTSIPTAINAGTYYVWYKVVGDQNHNDTAPACVTAIIRGTISATVTFKVVNGSWDDETTADKTVTLTGFEGDMLKLTANQIPAVGGKPDDTYKAGSWDTTPSTETAITEATTYTYTYAQKTAISQTVTFKVVNGKWDDETTEDKTVTLTGYEGDTLKLSMSQIPAVGGKPDDTYKAGSWDTTPSTETAITEATTYTYAYAQKEAATVTKTPTAKTLTYNGQAQELVEAGTATGGTMQYAIGTASEATQPYTTSIPRATDVGTYCVWYKVVGDANHSDTDPRCISVTITEAKGDYSYISGAEGTWQMESGGVLSFQIKNVADDSKTYGKFQSIVVDGKTVSETDYKKKPGSVIIELQPAYLETLNVGKHTLRVNFSDGIAETTFTIVPASVKVDSLPQTGDNSRLLLWIGLVIGGLVGVLFFARKRA